MDKDKLKCAIIAGGRSGRFGSDKSIYKYEGKTLIEYVFGAVSPVFEDIVIIANDSEKFSFLGVEVIPDIIPGLGPIGGIYTAVEKLDAERIFIFPCDMPFLSTDFIRYMTEIPDLYDIIVPEVNGRYQPLHSIYSKVCIEAIKRNIEAEDYRMSGFFEGHNIRIVGEEEIGYYDDPFRMFRNINFREDIEGSVH
ncbi:MAG TPA: molybdenum cofactor guanylyltransferase [Spirochaetota bacterium]|nr:molybdenum cofactor guanylyltransferase [Spirochaetota bacterium]HPJ36471.1 molybdenum cofactor guanylyltransferase [Spirochaetota bacterium]